MNEKPLERLKYYNGQRLEANDLKLEQEYHIRVRRWLNKSLYSSGIARGLEVHTEAGSATVVVGTGLALDAEGREIILLEEEQVPVMGQPSKTDGEVEGNYLTIQYREQTMAEEESGCTPRPNGHDKSGSRLAWGGPARLLAKPILGWSDIFPHEHSGKIVLGQVELDDNCKVRRVHVGVRRYVGAASAAKVHQFALDGEKHIDSNNPGRIYFHIRGRQPNAVTLYLRAQSFSTLYYTEMGWHEHTKTLTGNTETGPAKKVDDHTHSAAESMKTEFDSPEIVRDSPEAETAPVSGQHTDKHEVWAHISAKLDPPDEGGFFGWLTNPIGQISKIIDSIGKSKEYPGKTGPTGFALRVITLEKDRFVSLKDAVNMSVFYGKHQHKIVGKTGTPEDKPTPDLLHKHDLSTSLTIDKAGVDQVDVKYKARSGQNEKALTFVDDLKIWIGKSVSQADNKTDDILRQLRASQPSVTWDQLGKGAANPTHPLIEKGTGAIKLDFLPGIAFTEGEYVIDLRVERGGGRILYNLYVE